ncbi:hypothetical protein V6N11_051956 [Hibiscus sabdariffa]|uniref:Uncharacterized protein n=1 Tax=Hibiscus sabdariffa TaxID=183260 RepID=A0ABR2U9E6_9ROSI
MLRPTSSVSSESLSHDGKGKKNITLERKPDIEPEALHWCPKPVTREIPLLHGEGITMRCHKVLRKALRDL